MRLCLRSLTWWKCNIHSGHPTNQVRRNFSYQRLHRRPDVAGLLHPTRRILGNFSPPKMPQRGIVQYANKDELLDEETLPYYDPEEFYPVHTDEIFQQRYHVIGKLGFGANSTVWLCRDLR